MWPHALIPPLLMVTPTLNMDTPVPLSRRRCELVATRAQLVVPLPLSRRYVEFVAALRSCRPLAGRAGLASDWACFAAHCVELVATPTHPPSFTSTLLAKSLSLL